MTSIAELSLLARHGVGGLHGAAEAPNDVANECGDKEADQEARHLRNCVTAKYLVVVIRNVV